MIKIERLGPLVDLSNSATGYYADADGDVLIWHHEAGPDGNGRGIYLDTSMDLYSSGHANSGPYTPVKSLRLTVQE